MPDLGFMSIGFRVCRVSSGEFRLSGSTYYSVDGER